MPRASHTFEEHVGELRLRLDARARADLFAEAGRALAELFIGSERLPLPREGPETVELRAADPAALLVDWLNELVFRSETEGKVFVEFSFDRLFDGELEGSMRGVRVDELRTFVKAATLHDLEFKEKPDGISAALVLDI
jgi:SHS2 domain-containing protein